ncbi:type II toxin-antitoxin system prevent-host-death family antitoxin [Thermodesulfatator indicus]|uniref:type II toxin-antitoxin system Phd/YefM family antitoxin n=1 Tax=Thermodesulfatator indicus TaxID=171695 RepID=UPI00030B4AD2
MQVSVRELKSNLSRYLKEVKQGKIIEITRHRRLIAKLCPAGEHKTGIEALIAKGLVSWDGGKPKGGRARPKIFGKRMAERILEDRR